MKVKIIGAGLAGSEAAWQVAQSGIAVELFEMRPQQMTKAHRTGYFAELVCSNSFRGADLGNAVGLLKEELRQLNSLIMQAATFAQVPAGGSLAVDREIFSRYVTEKISAHPLISINRTQVTEVPEPTANYPVIIATGPLTSKALTHSIEQFTGKGNLAFFDAISPIILDESIDHSKVFRQSRYDKGGDDFINIPLTRDQYYEFLEAVLAAEKFGGHEEVEADEIENLRPFEGCMPIEDMASRGPQTLLFGPLKPVGLINPLTNEQPYAVIQLRQDDKQGHLWNMVGLQTRMKHPEQLRIFRSLPGLENAEFVRLGTVHRNTFIDSPNLLNSTLEFRTKPGLFFAGQITGVEGYVESTAGGLVAGLNTVRFCQQKPLLSLPSDTAIGSLMHYISDAERKNFQPMNVSFGLIKSYLTPTKRQAKAQRRLATAQRSLELIEQLKLENW